ncbi:BatD family protein [Algoriphagus vanfongensis]|uniref:BatD family protein n=1 Tax=Algoriphagus vanfongensis TaxID=426371 RepID=UPI000A054D4E|nr:BatD family protein [Algoriphagus vanfongensis]
MTKSLKSFLLLLALTLLSAHSLRAQSLFSQVSLDRKEAFVGQPIQVTISVYTSTWFTRGLSPQNLKVEGAFTAYFRPVSVSTTQNGKTYAGVKLIYNVFPYTDEDIEFPALDIEVETPAEGDFKGVKKVVKTEAQTIKIKPIPSKFSAAQWLVASDLTVAQNWKGSTRQMKVGEVLERSITRNAYGTVPELIPPVEWDSIPGVSLYPMRSEMANTNTETNISSRRVEKMRYLFEKEGTVTIPEQVFSWYNPARNQLYKRTLPAVEIEVIPNPDLGMLATVRDSLEINQQEMLEEEKADLPLTILGMSPKKFALVIALILLLAFVMILLLKRIFRIVQARRKTYLQSEAFYFSQVKKASKSGDRKAFIQALYGWIDHLELEEPSLASFVASYGNSELRKEVELLENQLREKRFSGISSFSNWDKARVRYSKRDTPIQDFWINPRLFKINN